MLKIKPDIVFSEKEDGQIFITSLLDEENCFFKIDGLASKIFKSLKDNKDLTQAKSEILKTYKVDELKLDTDISNFIKFLAKNDIIEDS